MPINSVVFSSFPTFSFLILIFIINNNPESPSSLSVSNLCEIFLCLHPNRPHTWIIAFILDMSTDTSPKVSFNFILPESTRLWHNVTNLCCLEFTLLFKFSITDETILNNNIIEPTSLLELWLDPQACIPGYIVITRTTTNFLLPNSTI